MTHRVQRLFFSRRLAPRGATCASSPARTTSRSRSRPSSARSSSSSSRRGRREAAGQRRGGDPRAVEDRAVGDGAPRAQREALKRRQSTKGLLKRLPRHRHERAPKTQPVANAPIPTATGKRAASNEPANIHPPLRTHRSQADERVGGAGGMGPPPGALDAFSIALTSAHACLLYTSDAADE